MSMPLQPPEFSSILFEGCGRSEHLGVPCQQPSQAVELLGAAEIVGFVRLQV